jgi:hypothetical protein
MRLAGTGPIVNSIGHQIALGRPAEIFRQPAFLRSWRPQFRREASEIICCRAGFTRIVVGSQGSSFRPIGAPGGRVAPSQRGPSPGYRRARYSSHDCLDPGLEPGWRPRSTHYRSYKVRPQLENHVNVRRAAMMKVEKLKSDRRQGRVADVCLETRMPRDDELDAVAAGTYVCVDIRWFTVDDKGTILPVHFPC